MANASYRRPLDRDSRILSELAGIGCQIVLLGSIATPKYADPLLEIFGERFLSSGIRRARGHEPGRAHATVRERRHTAYLRTVRECCAAWSQTPKIGWLARGESDSLNRRPLARG